MTVHHRSGVPALHVPRTPQQRWVVLPYSPSNRELVRTWFTGAKYEPPGKWMLRSRTEAALADLAKVYGQVLVRWEVQPGPERCDTRCRDAVGLDCTCRCGQKHHGVNVWGTAWREVGSSTLVRQGQTVWLERRVTAEQVEAIETTRRMVTRRTA